MRLQAEDFQAFFRAIHGHDPFPWQQRLASHLADTDYWPEVLDLPTGSGKTAAMDAAVFHLALRAEEPRRAAIRMVFVVDRRLVVDEAHRRAETVAERLDRALRTDESESDPVVREVASRLGRLAGEGAPPLLAVRLRGGAPLEHVWARSPSQPTILCSTVDQVGSRLLFRGYGVSDRMKPIHAGLLGDSLILLDEAHLSEPFRQTVEAVREFGRARVRSVLLTATPDTESAQDRFELSDEDRSNSILSARIATGKRATLRVVRSKKPELEFAAEAERVLQALRACPNARTPAVGVVVNRVALARRIYNELSRRHPEESASRKVVLMIGRSRGVDRDRIAKELAPFFTGAASRGEVSRTESRQPEGVRRTLFAEVESMPERPRPLIVVATQCLEVGVDLDLDGLVTQAAPLDALRQRFGRLRRSGVRAPGAAVERAAAILALDSDLRKSVDDPIYGDRLRRTWEWMDSVAEDSTLDFGVTALASLMRERSAIVSTLTTETANAPVAMPAYFDAWSRTSPIPEPEPEIGLFLHGAERIAGDVSIVWRNDIDAMDLDQPTALKDLMEIAPPRAGEMLPIPISAARKWFHGIEGAAAVGDVPSRETGGEPGSGRSRRRAFRWAGPDSSRTGIVEPSQLGRLRPGDVLVVPAEYGGCDDFGWNPTSRVPVRDAADTAAEPYRGRRHFVRLSPARCGEEAWRSLSRVVGEHDGHPKHLVQPLLEALSGHDTDEESEGRPVAACRDLLALLKHPRGRIGRLTPYRRGAAADGIVLFAPRGVHGEAPAPTLAPTTEDASLSREVGHPLSLAEHSEDVEGQVEQSTTWLGLEPTIRSDLMLAGYLHDAGKADSRFQIMLSGGNPWNTPAEAASGVLAKSGRPYSRTNWKRSGLPEQWRHEALSVRLAILHPRFSEANDPALVLWLIGTHHGLGRPFYPVAEPAIPKPRPALGVSSWNLLADLPGPDSPAFSFEGLTWPDLFRTLSDRYGAWELARYEAIVRLADHHASAKAEREAAS